MRTEPIFHAQPTGRTVPPSVASPEARGSEELAQTLLGAAEVFTGARIDSNHFADADERRYGYF